MPPALERSYSDVPPINSKGVCSWMSPGIKGICNCMSLSDKGVLELVRRLKPLEMAVMMAAVGHVTSPEGLLVTFLGRMLGNNDFTLTLLISSQISKRFSSNWQKRDVLATRKRKAVGTDIHTRVTSIEESDHEELAQWGWSPSFGWWR